MTTDKVAWGWLAGLFDGEGCIHINRQRVSGRTDLLTDSFRLYAQITMGHRPALERCLEIAGVGSIQKHSVSTLLANKAYCWMTAARDAQQVLQSIRPLLIIKGEEADVALAFCAIAPWYGGRYRGRKPDALVDHMLCHYWRLRMLKPRWRFYEAKLSRTDRAEIRRLHL